MSPAQRPRRPQLESNPGPSSCEATAVPTYCAIMPPLNQIFKMEPLSPQSVGDQSILETDVVESHSLRG